MVRDERDANRSFKTYTIPRKERRPSEDCQFTLPVDSREAKEIEHAVRRLTWDTTDLDRAVSISHIKKVDNPNLEREYHEKRATLREEGRSSKELTQQLAFCVETEDSRVKEICRLGLECEGENHTLGDGSMGVTVWKCPDLCLRALSWPASGTAYLVVFKIVKGRVKSVTPKLSSEAPNLEPTPNYDCHMSRSPASSSVTDLATLMRSTQYYLYEYDDEGLPSKRPRHCLPFAVIPLKRNERTANPVKPLASIPLEKPPSPVKESAKRCQDTKTPSFSDEDGILAWRGLVTSNEKSLGCVSLLAGHKLGLNFWKSYLDISRKMPLRQLAGMLPGDIRSAWKSPLLYRNHVLSLCTMKATPRQPRETFTSFTRHLAIRAKSAGVLCIDSSTTMFFVPSCKLTVHLGFCATEKPPRMFCIVCRRQSTPLSPSFVWPLANTVTLPVGGGSPLSSHTVSPVATVATAIRPASLDLKTQHKAKIVVSSPENNFRLSPKHTHPRQIAKRSLSFPFSPAKNASKSLLRFSRSASTSGSDDFREDSTARPAILSDVSGDSGIQRSGSVSLGDDSGESRGDFSDNPNEHSHLCLNSLSSREIYQDGPCCNGFETEQAKKTRELNGASSVSANTLANLTPELVTVYNSHLATLKKCSNVSKKPHCGNVGSEGSELKPPTPVKPLDLQTSSDASSKMREFEQHCSPQSPLKRSISTDDLEKTHLVIDTATPSTVKDASQGNLCAGEKLTSSISDRRKNDVSLTSTSLAHRLLERSRVKAIPSPTRGGLSPSWPDSPIVFSSALDRIPFLSGTPVRNDGPTESERNLSVKPSGNWCLNRSQTEDELSANASIDEADSTSRDLAENPFLASEKKAFDSASLHLENWNKNSSFLNDKEALRSLRKAAALQKSPTLHKNTESHDDLQTIDMEISEPSDIDSSNLLNKNAVESLSKEATKTRIAQLHDDLQTVDMEISESPQCPIILSHAYSCAPTNPPYDSSSRKLNEAGCVGPCARGYKLPASDTLAGSVHKNGAKTSELLSSVFSNAGNAWKEDAGSVDVKTTHRTKLNSGKLPESVDAHDGKSFAVDQKTFAVNSTTVTVQIDSKNLESVDIVEPVDMDIADDLEHCRNTVALENDATMPPPSMEVVEDGCTSKSSEEPHLPTEKMNDPSENENSSTEDANPTNVSRMSEDASPTLETKLSCGKRSYSSLRSSLEQYTENSVTKDLEQKPVHTMYTKTSDAATEKTCSPSKKSPTTCSLTNREAVGFSFSPKKSSKPSTRQLKTLQDAFTAATNCDKPNLCASDGERSAERSCVDCCKSLLRSSPTSDSKTQTKDVENKQALIGIDCVSRTNSDDSATIDKSNDCKPLADCCTVFEKDVTHLSEHTVSQLGGVIEMSLFQDWGFLKVATDSSKLQVREEDSSIVAEDDGCTEVADLGSQADQAPEPIETWPMIEICDLPEPETVLCSPLNSIETFTLRFPGKDIDEVSQKETTTTEEETILVEERFRGVCVVPEVVICSNGNSQTIVVSSEDLPGECPPKKDSEEPSLRQDFKTSEYHCGHLQTSDKIASVESVYETSAEELHVSDLSEKCGTEHEDFNVLEGSGSIHPDLAENCRESRSEKLSECLAPQSLETSEEDAVIQTKQSEVSQALESEDVATPVIPKPEIFTGKLNTAQSLAMETTENVSLVGPREETTAMVKAGNYSSETKEIRPGNAVADSCPGKLPCSTEVEKSNEQSGNVTQREKTESPSESSADMQEKRHDETSAERVQDKSSPRELLETRVDPQQQRVISSYIEPTALPTNCSADNLKLKPLRDDKPFTVSLNEGVKPTKLDSQSVSPTRNNSECHSSGVNNDTACTAIKDVSLKSTEPRAKITNHDKSVEETIKTVESKPSLSKNPEVETQEGNKKDGRFGTRCDRDSKGKSEPLRDINDPQKDNRVLNGKRKHSVEPEKMTKQRKLSPVPSLGSPVGGTEHDHNIMAPQKSRELNIGDNRFYRHNTERGPCEYNQAEYHREGSRLKTVHEHYSYPRWIAPAIPAYISVRNRERNELPHLIPNGPRWYQPRGVTNQTRFHQVYPRLPDRGRPMFTPAPTIPGTWPLLGNSRQVPYPLLRPR